MTEEMEERRVPSFVVNEEEHVRIKRELQLTEYQIRLFEKALRNRKKVLSELREGEEMRKEVFRCKYRTVEELNQAYIVGAIKDDREYMRQRSAIWQVYSDRNHLKEIEWLETELLKYYRKKENIEALIEKKRKDSLEARRRRYNKRKRWNNYMRKYRKKRKKEELEERWRRYGLI